MMTFRRIIAVTLVAQTGLVTACDSNGAKSANATGAKAGTSLDSSAGALAATGATVGASPTTAGASDTGKKLPQNHNGRIPVLEYHVIGRDKNSLYTRTVASFKADLEDVYKRGYRPITIAQMLDKNFADVPDGMSPVVFVFDDASPEQFSYVEGTDGKLTIDPNSGVGIWLDFAKTHPGWKNRGTFCLLNGASVGHNFFGDNTVWHAMLNKFSDAVVQEQIARNVMAIDSAVPGYKVRTMALPYGIWPKNRQLAWEGSWTDPKTKQTHTYKFDAVLEVAGGPARSPFDPQFNPHSINRIEAIGSDISKQLDALDKNKTRFVK
jgi:hypothetical protein